MQKYRDNVTIVGRGGLAPVRNATATVYVHGTTSKAVIYTNAERTPKANPFQADSLGVIAFYAENGHYDILVQGEGQEIKLTDVLMEDVYEDVDALNVQMPVVRGIAESAQAVAEAAAPKPDLADTTDLAKGAAMVGVPFPDENADPATVLDYLLRLPVNAALFGFHPSNSRSANALAIVRASQYANGRPVIVDASDDYNVDRIQLDGSLAFNDILFTGKGRAIHDDSTVNYLIGCNNTFVGVQPVTSMSVVTTTIQGTADREATAIVVADASEYQAGDWARIYSDDIDPEARTGYTARRGEAAYVLQVDQGANTIYLSRQLEDYDYYITNVRIARYSRNRVRIKGLKVKSTATTSSANVVQLTGGYRHEVEADMESVGPNCTGIRLNAVGLSDIVLRGTGNVDGVSLNYGVVDSRGFSNRVRNSSGYGWRHFVTTAFNSITENSPNPSNYGAPRDLVVQDCDASGCYVPFDTHEGSRRAKFINCKAMNSSGGLTSQAFNIRGRDETIDGCYVDKSYGVALRVTTANGTIEANNCQFYSSQLMEQFDGAGDLPERVIFNNCTGVFSDLPTYGILGQYLYRMKVVLNGGVYIVNGLRDPATATSVFRFISASAPVLNPTVEFVCDPLFILNVNPSGNLSRFILQSGVGANAAATVYGKCRIENTSGIPISTLISRASGTTNATVDLDINWQAGEYTSAVNATSPGWSYLRYRIHNRVARPMTDESFQW